MGKGRSKGIKKRLILKELWLELLVLDPLQRRNRADRCVSPVFGSQPGTELGLGVQHKAAEMQWGTGEDSQAQPLS